MPDNEDFEQYGFSLINRIVVLAILLASAFVVILSIYGATRLYYRSDDIALVKNLKAKIVQQELIVKSLNEKLEVAENGTREAKAEAQLLLRAHKWVGIFRSVLPKCIDDDWDGEVENVRNNK